VMMGAEKLVMDKESVEEEDLDDEGDGDDRYHWNI
jgi:hypothetical protein